MYRRKNRNRLPNLFSNPLGLGFYEKEEDPENPKGQGGGEIKDKDLLPPKEEKHAYMINGMTQELSKREVQQLVDLGVLKWAELEEAKKNPPKKEEENEAEETDEEVPKYAKKLLSKVETLQAKIDDLEESGKTKEKKAALKQQLDLLLDNKKLEGKARNVVARLTLMNVSLGHNTKEAFESAIEEFTEAAGKKKPKEKDIEHVKEKLKDALDTEVETGESGTDTGIEKKKPFSAEDMMSGKLRQALVKRAKLKA